jgi:hypothetical protein
MGKRLNLLWNKEKNYTQLASVNCQAIREYNEKNLSALTLIGGLLMMLPLLVAPLSNTKTDVILAYLLAATLFFTLFRQILLYQFSLILTAMRSGTNSSALTSPS